MKQRTGSMLAEAVICMSIGSSLMLLAISIAHQALTTSSNTRHRCDLNRIGMRLEQQLRSDVHRAQSLANTAADRVEIELHDKTTVTYAVADRDILRTRSLPSGEKEYERFALGDDRSATFRSLDDPARLELTVLYTTRLDHVAPRIELHVVAVTGKLVDSDRTTTDSSEAAQSEGDKQ